MPLSTANIPAGFPSASITQRNDCVVGGVRPPGGFFAIRAPSTRPAATTVARLWFLFAVGSLVFAGLLSLTFVVGRLPFMGWLFTDPLFFKSEGSASSLERRADGA